MFPVPMNFLIPNPMGAPFIYSQSRIFPFPISKFIPEKIFPVWTSLQCQGAPSGTDAM